MDIAKHRRDLKTISNGKWVDDNPKHKSHRLKVRGMNSPEAREYRAALEREVGPEGRDENGTLTQESSLVIVGKVLSERVLLNWEGVTVNGAPVEYSLALAREWCQNPEYEDFGDAVVWAAAQVDKSKIPFEEAVVGNSQE